MVVAVGGEGEGGRAVGALFVAAGFAVFVAAGAVGVAADPDVATVGGDADRAGGPDPRPVGAGQRGPGTGPEQVAVPPGGVAPGGARGEHVFPAQLDADDGLAADGDLAVRLGPEEGAGDGVVAGNDHAVRRDVGGVARTEIQELGGVETRCRGQEYRREAEQGRSDTERRDARE